MKLTLQIPGAEGFNPATNEFVYTEGRVLHLEHSLYSVSLWESRWKKAYLNTDKTPEEMLDYIRCMSEEPVDDETLARLSKENWKEILDFLNDRMTATTFGKDNGSFRRKRITNEEIYYLMAKFGIPFTCEHWHFNRLMTLLRVCTIREGKQKPMSRAEILKRQSELNAKRRAASGSKG